MLSRPLSMPEPCDASQPMWWLWCALFGDCTTSGEIWCMCALIELEMQWVWSCRLTVGGRLERPRAMEEGEEFVLDCICMASSGEPEGAKVEGTLPVRVFR